MAAISAFERPLLEQLHHIGLARGQQVPGRPGSYACVRRGGRQHVQAAGGEIDRVQDVAGLGALGQAGGGAEPEHLPTLRAADGRLASTTSRVSG